jgi:hypothetical protein
MLIFRRLRNFNCPCYCEVNANALKNGPVISFLNLRFALRMGADTGRPLADKACAV